MGIPYYETDAMMEASNMFILTNNQEYYGASYLCCPDVLKLVSKKMGGDFLILPSSVNEIIILREREDIDISELQGMLELSNEAAVSREEFLSDNVYRYDSQEQKISVIDYNNMQQGMKLL